MPLNSHSFKKKSDFVSNSYNHDVFIVGCTIRELCISRGEEHCLFNKSIKNYLFTRTDKFIMYISAKCSKYLHYIQTQSIVDIMHIILL